MHDLFKKRRSHRQFTDEDVSDEQINSILTAAMVSPTGSHAQPWEFVVVRNKEIIAKFSELGQWQSFAANAPVAIVICAREEDSKLWLEDCSIAAAHMYLEATNLGLGTCWANIRNGKTTANEDREGYVRSLLGIPDDYRVVCIMPIGHPASELPEYTDNDYIENKVHEGSW